MAIEASLFVDANVQRSHVKAFTPTQGRLHRLVVLTQKVSDVFLH